LQLLEDGGYFGNVTTLRLVYQSNLSELHDLLREKLKTVDMACFAHRPQQVFPNAIVRIAILTGGRTESDESGEIRTSKFLQFDSDNRSDVFENIDYSPVEGLELRERIGGSDRSYEVLPKVGPEINRSILEKLRSASSGRIISDAESDGETDYPVFRRRGGGYWLNAVPVNIHGDVTTIEPIYFESELEQDTAFLLVNSSLFYLYWMTYADFRHLNTGHITRFPIPKRSVLEEYRDEITELSDALWSKMQSVHAGGNRDQFDMPQVKPKIDDVDNLLGELYELSGEEVSYLQQYNTEYGRRGPKNQKLTPEQPQTDD
jgi:hypothetical protein